MLALVAATVPAQIAKACTIAIHAETLTRKVKKTAEQKAYEVGRRELCKAVARDRQAFIMRVSARTAEIGDVYDLLGAFRDGSYGCRKDPAFAFDIRNAMIPDPIPMDTTVSEIGDLLGLAADAKKNFNAPRLKEARATKWLLSGGPNVLPEGWREDELRDFLFAPQRWNAALKLAEARHPVNQARDRMMLEAAMNPAGPKFDLTLAIRMHRTYDDLMNIAAMLLDPAIGTPDYERARRLLSISSPYFHDQATLDLQRIREPLWGRIAAHYIESGDAASREKGLAMLAGTEMNAPAEAKPDIAGLVQLANWPATLPSVDITRIITPDDYPSRAMREEAVGAVQVALLFGPDGAFSRLWVSRSSGNVDLDEKTTTLILRRARPRIDQLRLDGHAGHPVLVPLPVIEWHLTASEAIRPVGVQTARGQIAITAALPKWVTYDSLPCGSSYSHS